MLPSEETVSQYSPHGRGHSRGCGTGAGGGAHGNVSVGSHLTIRRCDQQRAMHNQNIQDNYNLREHVWRNRL